MLAIKDPAAQVQEGLENKAIMLSAVYDFLLLHKKTKTRQLTNEVQQGNHLLKP